MRGLLTGGLGILVLTILAGCARSAQIQDPDYLFGSSPRAAGERKVLVITPPEEEVDFFQYPVPIDSVLFRVERPAGAVDSSWTTRVEVLVMGALPDACARLHDFTSERYGNMLRLNLIMRKPTGAVCAAVITPFRYYGLLPGTYAPGYYHTQFNGLPFAFEVREPEYLP